MPGNETLNHRDRVLAAIRHQPVDRLPTDIWATPEVRQRLLEYFNLEDGAAKRDDAAETAGARQTSSIHQTIALLDRLDIDGIVGAAPPYVGPETPLEDGYTENEWGMGFRLQDYGVGAYSEQVRYPLAQAETIADLDSYRWPDPDWYDYDALPALLACCQGRARGVGYTSFLYYHGMLRGLEQSLVDPVLKPDFTHHLLALLSDFFTEYHRRCFEAAPGLIDITEVTDDLGTQNGLLISPRTFDAFYSRPMQRAVDLAKSHALIVFHHDDGDMRRMLPRLVDMGIDVLNPIQWRCGDWNLMDLKAQFGNRVCFHGAVDNQRTLPYGTPKDVETEVRSLIDSLASDRTGFIIGPCHCLQPNTPTENIIALYDTARAYGTFES